MTSHIRTTILFAVHGLIGCATGMEGINTQTMIKVKEDRVYSPVGSRHYSFEDEHIKISFIPDIVESGVNFEFENKTKEAIRIIWDETAYINEIGESKRIMHEGVKFVDRTQSQPPSVIPPHAKMSDNIGPTDKVQFYSGMGGIWDHQPLCGQRTQDYRLDDKMCVGQTFGFFITYDVAGKKKNVTLKYKYVSRKEREPEKGQPVDPSKKKQLWESSI